MCDQDIPDIPLPSGWPENVKSAVLYVISLAHYAITCARGWAPNSINARVRLAAKSDRLQQEVELLQEQIRIRDARMARVDPHRRPHYSPTERMAILELRAARGWSLAQTAKVFLVQPRTIASWLKRIDEEGNTALVQLREPVNKFPDFIRYIVQRVKALCPSLGKRKIAQILARAGLHLGSTTVQRMIKSKAVPPPADPADQADQTNRVVTAKALAAGFQGAMFPWESADTGDEACPPYVPDPKTGEPVRVLTGELQHHISADVVYAAWRYVRATGDEAYRRKQLLPLAILTARFWASRVWWNRHKGRYEIHDVIGPDEYHEHVRNNAYTNFLAAWNLRLAADEVNRAQAAGSGVRVLRRLDVTDAELGRWREIANGIFLPVLADQGLWEQFEGFLNLRSADPATLSSRKSRLKEKARMRRLARAQVLKQPDVLMLMALFPDKFDRAVRRRNWDYYEPKTTHDSSLSPSVHCLVAADIGLCGKAFEYFRATARIDLDDSMGNTDAGLHFAAIGGTWQAVVKGFLGLRLEGEKPTVNPKLPRQWKSLTMPLRHRDRRYDIQASRAGGVIRVRD